MMKLKYALMMVLGLSASASMIGCEAKEQAKGKVAGKAGAVPNVDDHDHGDHKPATSLKEALETIEKYRAEIKEAFSKKQPEDADDTIHEVGHSLESLTNLAGATTEEAKQSVKKAVDELFACFGAMDDTVHGKLGKSYDEVGDRIDAALAVLKAMAK